MRRWNGWGDDTIDYPLPASAREFLSALVGPASPPTDAELRQVVARVPDSRLAPHPLISTDPVVRVHHARGQSLPDWVALRTGMVDAFPDGVAFPSSGREVRTLVDYACRAGASLIPYGGGTSVLGHINPRPSGAPVLTVDMSRMNRLRRLDELSLLATFEAGVRGPDLEAQLRAQGYTLGHYPQSFELSTLGGWVSTRSSGQQSLGFGRIERLFAGCHLESPAGPLEVLPFPASAAGPDLREMVLGSEGRLGVLTEVTVRISPLPQRDDFHAVFFPQWEHGQEAVRRIVQARLPLSMLRLSTAAETATTLALAGHERIIGALESLLSLRGIGAGKCLLILGFTGAESLVAVARREAIAIVRHCRGVHVGRAFGNQWRKSRFRSPYLRNTLWEMGYALDTLETAAEWSKIDALSEAIEAALTSGLDDIGERVHVFTHLSHVYPYGSSVYTTYLFRIAPDPEETLRRWKVLKSAASRAIIDRGGTISHHHGVGEDHLVYMEAEKGPLGATALRNLCRTFDPTGTMNPGKLVGG